MNEWGLADTNNFRHKLTTHLDVLVAFPLNHYHASLHTHHTLPLPPSLRLIQLSSLVDYISCRISCIYEPPLHSFTDAPPVLKYRPCDLILNFKVASQFTVHGYTLYTCHPVVGHERRHWWRYTFLGISSTLTSRSLTIKIRHNNKDWTVRQLGEHFLPTPNFECQNISLKWKVLAKPQLDRLLSVQQQWPGESTDVCITYFIT